jgi:hypothetical protein
MYTQHTTADPSIIPEDSHLHQRRKPEADIEKGQMDISDAEKGSTGVGENSDKGENPSKFSQIYSKYRIFFRKLIRSSSRLLSAKTGSLIVLQTLSSLLSSPVGGLPVWSTIAMT